MCKNNEIILKKNCIQNNFIYILLFFKEPELHKAMVLLLARCWDYRLKTEDVLELTQVWRNKKSKLNIKIELKIKNL